PKGVEGPLRSRISQETSSWFPGRSGSLTLARSLTARSDHARSRVSPPADHAGRRMTPSDFAGEPRGGARIGTVLILAVLAIAAVLDLRVALRGDRTPIPAETMAAARTAILAER